MGGLLDESWENLNRLIIYGFGKSGQANTNMFLKEFEVPFIIDNNAAYKGKMYRNIPIINLEQYRDIQKPEDKIVIIASGGAYLSIKESLAQIGKHENIDYVGMDTFVNEWYWRFHHKVCLGRVTVSVTTSCTLNCRYCNMFIPYFKDSEAFDVRILCEDADLFFSLVDYVTSFTVVGGEPFLYKELATYLNYIEERHGDKIGNLQIITNGTILPNEEVLFVVKKWDIEVRISDYTEIVPYRKRLDDFVRLLEDRAIDYVVFKQDMWLDFGLPNEKINMGNSEEELRRHMLSCNSMCHLIYNGYYYYCSRAWCAEKAGLFCLEDGDKIDLTELAKKPSGKEELLHYHMGNMKNGYLSYCKVCRGYRTDKMVKAGEQEEKFS